MLKIIDKLFQHKELDGRVRQRMDVLCHLYETAVDKDALLRSLDYDTFRIFSEYQHGKYARDTADFLKHNPQYNSRLQEYYFSLESKGLDEGTYLSWDRLYHKLDEIIRRGDIKTFIDLGCNSGEIVHRVSQRGIDAVGVDLPQVVKKITLPIRRIAADLNSDNLEGKYDLILCRETFEHISDERRFLNMVREMLTDTGWFLLSCPYTTRQFHGNALHLNVQSKETLSRLLKETGFKIEEIYEQEDSNSFVLRKA
jgi:2-polyprenyl-3-methyl-5-hydroxy-6-metoxy-1,4-benzoquinol methylase